MAWQLIRYLGLKLISCWLFTILSRLIFLHQITSSSQRLRNKSVGRQIGVVQCFLAPSSRKRPNPFYYYPCNFSFFLKCVGYTFETWTGDHSLLLLRVAVCLRKSFDTAAGFFKKKKKKKKKSFNGKMFNFLKRKILEQQEKKLKSSSSW